MPGIDECLREVMSLPGALGAALVDWTSGLALGTAGRSPVGDHETTAAETAELARAAAEYESFAPDAAVVAPGPAPTPMTGPAEGPAAGPARGSVPMDSIPGPNTGPNPASIAGLTPVPAPGLTPLPIPAPWARDDARGRPGGPPAGPPAGAHTGAAAPDARPTPSASPATAPPLPALPVGVDPEAPPVEDVIVTTRTGYHVLRFVETTFDSSVFLHLWLDRSTGNLALARLRLRELAERLVLV
ncbi:hypothetical protein GCM10010393_29620 [Streptomyces gobitricini]|uniref:Uncharacterized protein n=1 Tax=Streptomyces gobitricini TaxID=68211 RepID=A0ABP5ZIJ9_9ACTN